MRFAPVAGLATLLAWPAALPASEGAFDSAFGGRRAFTLPERIEVAADGLPGERERTVRFPGEEMRVVGR